MRLSRMKNHRTPAASRFTWVSALSIAMIYAAVNESQPPPEFFMPAETVTHRTT